jgi:hypothetical protein
MLVNGERLARVATPDGEIVDITPDGIAYAISAAEEPKYVPIGP